MKSAVIIFALFVSAFGVPAQNGMVRIEGGNAAKAGQFPYTASLQYKSGGIVFDHQCACTIISPSWSLTVAQCRDSFDLSRYRIVAGLLNQGENTGAQITGIDEFILHPKYRGGKGAFDIGLLLHTNVLQWTDTVKPAKLPASSASDPSGNAVISTWGSGKSLQWSDLALISHDACAKALNDVSGSQGSFDNSQICTAGDKTVVCNDDLGGSLVQDGTVVGAHSWSVEPCGTKGAPDVYIKIQSHLDFIHENVFDL